MNDCEMCISHKYRVDNEGLVWESCKQGYIVFGMPTMKASQCPKCVRDTNRFPVEVA